MEVEAGPNDSEVFFSSNCHVIPSEALSFHSALPGTEMSWTDQQTLSFHQLRMAEWFGNVPERLGYIVGHLFHEEINQRETLSNMHTESRTKCWDYLLRICFKRAQATLIYFWENIWLTIVNDEFRCCALDQLLKVWEHLILYIAAIWTKLFF